MESCCLLCDKVLETGVPHSELTLLSELSGSKIYKCHSCKTFIHFSLGDWEILMPGLSIQPESSPNILKPNASNKKPQLLAS